MKIDPLIATTTKATDSEILASLILHQARHMNLSAKQFQSAIVIALARFGQDLPALLQLPVNSPSHKPTSGKPQGRRSTRRIASA